MRFRVRVNPNLFRVRVRVNPSSFRVRVRVNPSSFKVRVGVKLNLRFKSKFIFQHRLKHNPKLTTNPDPTLITNPDANPGRKRREVITLTQRS